VAVASELREDEVFLAEDSLLEGLVLLGPEAEHLLVCGLEDCRVPEIVLFEQRVLVD
jgi:hypothetical protein